MADHARDLALMMLGTLEAIWTGAKEGKAPDADRLRERIDWYDRELKPGRSASPNQRALHICLERQHSSTSPCLSCWLESREDRLDP